MMVLGPRAVAALLPFDPLITALRDAFADETEVPVRHHHRVDERLDATLLVMPAWRRGGYLIVKLVNVFPQNSKAGQSALSSVVVLSSATTGEQLAVLDGNEITRRRTVAASALAASYLARADARTHLVVGAGSVGSLATEALRAVRDIEQVLVFDRNQDAANALAQRLSREGLKTERVDDLRSSAADADVITCATFATAPVIRGSWLRPGTHLDLIGSFTPSMRETDDDAIARASVFIDTPTALQESGDLTQPLNSGVLNANDVEGTLFDLCRRNRTARRDDREITLFKAVGTALEDLTAAALVFRSWSARQDQSDSFDARSS